MSERKTEPASYCLFQEPWWLDLVTGGAWEEVAISDGEGVVARLPFVRRRRRGMTVLSQPPMTPYMGPWFRPSNGKASNQFSDRRSATVELLGKLPRYDLFSQNLWPGVPDWLPFYWSGFQQTTGYTSWITDLTNMDAVWSSFVDVARWEVRKAQKKIHVVLSDDVDRLVSVYRLTFEQQNMGQPVDAKTLARVVEGVLKRGQGRLSFAQDDAGNTHAANFLIFDGRTAHYNVGGSDKRYRSSGAASLLVWEAIQFAAQHAKVFDFEGSMTEGISRFFRSFNPVLTPFLHVTGLSRKAAVAIDLYNAGAALVGRPRLRL